MEKSEKNFLEKLADAIPGLSGYRAREDRRETDKRLREYLGGRIDRVRGKIDDLKLGLTNSGNLAALNDVGLLQRKLQQLGDSIRFASYGYTGVFDQLKIKEEQLDLIYTKDLALVAAVEQIEKAIAASDVASATKAASDAEELFAQRKTFFDAP
jgi:hypothetical protein